MSSPEIHATQPISYCSKKFFNNELLTQTARSHSGQLAVRLHDKSIGTKILCFIPSVIAHGLDLISITIKLAASLIISVGYTLAVVFTGGQVKGLNEYTKKIWLLTVDSLIVMGIDLLGLVIGPFAYKIDKWVVDNITPKFFPDFPSATHNAYYLMAMTNVLKATLEEQ